MNPDECPRCVHYRNSLQNLEIETSHFLSDLRWNNRVLVTNIRRGGDIEFIREVIASIQFYHEHLMIMATARARIERTMEEAHQSHD